MGLLEDTKNIYNWEPSDGDYIVKESDPRRKKSLRLLHKKKIPFASAIVLIIILLGFFIGYYLS